MLVSDVCLAAYDGVTAVWVPAVVQLSDVCVAAGDGSPP
jgi:hypothetical protein